MPSLLSLAFIARRLAHVRPAGCPWLSTTDPIISKECSSCSNMSRLHGESRAHLIRERSRNYSRSPAMPSSRCGPRNRRSQLWPALTYSYLSAGLSAVHRCATSSSAASSCASLTLLSLAVGYYLGKKGIVDAKTKRTLNKVCCPSDVMRVRARTDFPHPQLNQSIFTPALLCVFRLSLRAWLRMLADSLSRVRSFGKVAFTLTPAKLAELWIVPVG